MKTAQHYSDVTDVAISKKEQKLLEDSQKQLEVLEPEISQAADNGDRVLYYTNFLDKQALNILKDLGFIISDCGDGVYTRWEIQWKKT